MILVCILWIIFYQGNIMLFLVHTQQEQQKSTSVDSSFTLLEVDHKNNHTVMEPMKRGNGGNLPGIAWLMTYPNSGTSFTMQLVHHVSNLTIATNYGKEYQHRSLEYLEPVPLSNDSPNGPFLLFPEKPLPSADSFILTKTHCGGYCLVCRGSNIMSKDTFKRNCALGMKVTKNMKKRTVTYDFNIAEKAIHVIRDPFSNVVSNFHLDWNRHKKTNDTEWLQKYPNNSSGFKQWCRYVDDFRSTVEDQHSSFLSISKLYKEVPCYTIFHMLIQWHTLAREVMLDLHLPTLVIHYEEYEHNFESTVSNIMEFLNLPRALDPIAFISGKDYKDYFSFEEQLAVKKLVQAISDDWTWNEISKYFTY
jgi:hypothetical protein